MNKKKAGARPSRPVMAVHEDLVADVKSLLWGPTVKEDVFKRWAQGKLSVLSLSSSIYVYIILHLYRPSGFYFSPHEHTALIQAEGGPCAVIAPLQAYILKQLLAESDITTWHQIKPQKCDQLLVKAMTETLAQAADPTNLKYSVLLMDKPNSTVNGEVPVEEQMSVDGEPCTENTSTAPVEPVIESKVFHSRLR